MDDGDNTRAILRTHLGNEGGLSAGTLCLVDHGNFSAGYHGFHAPGTLCRFVAVSNKSSAVWADASYFLPLREFLQRQPAVHFWFLMHMARFMDRDVGFCLADAKTKSFGPFPFRFESEGELMYYVKCYDLSLRDFLISKTSWKPWTEKNLIEERND